MKVIPIRGLATTQLESASGDQYMGTEISFTEEIF